jgi:hypothetical protein
MYIKGADWLVIAGVIRASTVQFDQLGSTAYHTSMLEMTVEVRHDMIKSDLESASEN